MRNVHDKGLMTNTARKVSKYGVFLVLIFLYLVRIQENTDPKKSGHVSRSITFIELLILNVYSALLLLLWIIELWLLLSLSFFFILIIHLVDIFHHLFLYWSYRLNMLTFYSAFLQLVFWLLKKTLGKFDSVGILL